MATGTREGEAVGATAKLSRLQRSLLLALLAYAERCDADRAGGPPLARVAARDGAPLHMLRGGGERSRGPKSAADSAAFSRALRRLEARGLVVRANFYALHPAPGRPPSASRRATHAALTDAGREAAKRLRSDSPGPDHNRLPEAAAVG